MGRHRTLRPLFPELRRLAVVRENYGREGLASMNPECGVPASRAHVRASAGFSALIEPRPIWPRWRNGKSNSWFQRRQLVNIGQRHSCLVGRCVVRPAS
jgi:hypothetical protein